MPLFVPILRVAMLFLNVYESYKTLKPPLPSSRTAKPSIRALSQRKRDMKGCLAVWTVWCCFTVYERFVEAIISLFIPFYDEFKSMALLFLILTRARGAEPLYLHVIRPLLKPYTSTIDSALDLLRMIGDFLFALAMYPLLIAWERWHKTFGFGEEVLESDTDGLSEQLNLVENAVPVEVSENVASLAISSAQAAVGPGLPENIGLQFPKKTNAKRPQLDTSSRGSSAETSRNISHSRQIPEASSSRGQEHRIWYPPRSSYTEEDGARTSHVTTAAASQESVQPEATIVQEEVEEWRKYPPFPSAYPPTPIIATSRLMATGSLRRTTNFSGTSLDPTFYPPIMEDAPQQDFHESLLPPRRPLNPGLVSDLSDDNMTLGVPHTHMHLDDTPMAVDDHDHDNDDSMSDDYEDEEEDDFNITLRTPLPPLGSFRSHPPPVPPLPVERLSSIASSAASRSTTLTTTGASSLRTRTSSESSLSGSASLTDSSSVPERKPLSPQTQTVGVKARMQQLESSAKENNASLRTTPKASGRRKTPLKRRRTSRTAAAVPTQAGTTSAGTSGGTAEEETTSSDALHGDDDDVDAEGLNDSQKAPETKRRKVVVPQLRVVPAARPVRPRVTRHASPPTRAQQGKAAGEAVNAPSVAVRTSARLRSGTNGRGVMAANVAASPTASSASASQTSLSSASGEKAPSATPAAPVRPLKVTKKTTASKAK